MTSTPETAPPLRAGTLTTPAPRRGGQPSVPVWPVIVLVAGYPVAWALGLAVVFPVVMALVQVAFLIQRGTFRVDVVLGLYVAFALWALTSLVLIDSPGQAVGYVQKYSELVVAGVVLAYARALPGRSLRYVVDAMVAFWVAVVLLGELATWIPDVRLQAPFGVLLTSVLPGAISGNELVRDLLLPSMAEVQQIWGASEPFNRPAAPFPYANSWGSAVALLTPVVLARLTWSSRRTKILLLAVLVLSIHPILASGNRSMALALAVCGAYVTIRLIARGRLRSGARLLTLGALAVVALIASGAVGSFFERQVVSGGASADTRVAVYVETVRATLQSPLVGWANPRTDSTIGIALGTQGQIWSVMYSYGFVGLALFCAFLAALVWRARRAPGTAGLWLHGVLIASVVMLPFYRLGVMQMVVLVCVGAVLTHPRVRELLPDPRGGAAPRAWKA
ncbi:O-antigen ligase family protein [Nocardioides albus]|uniref:O-antigen ligase domain-containing protein n=1 Tax=Nocardioides albus TaxID=1841 RepID=A0A7W5A8R0_9ACTN|nr:hypothetical protein [Nocardioides albus]MBB3091474.1 hypothetical protein [Nocardioides albus]